MKDDAISYQMMSDIPRGNPSKRLKDQTPPQARFLLPQTVKEHTQLRYDPGNPGAKIMIGAIGKQLIGVEDNRHIMTIAGSRAGKSVMLIGNLLFYPGSIVAIDSKAELSEKTAMARAKKGQKVYILDPFKIVKGEAAKFRACFNPMKKLNIENPYIIEDALQLVDALIISSGEEKDPHWNESASHFILGIMLFLATDPETQDADRHLCKVRYYINHALSIGHQDDDNGKSLAFYLFEAQVRRSVDLLKKNGHEELADVIWGSVRGFYDKSQDERGSVLSTARRHTQFLDFKSMRHVLSAHDFDLPDIVEDPRGVSVYLVLPASRLGQCNRWFRAFINQLLEVFERAPAPPTIPTLLCLDEFPVLGFMKQLQDAAGQIASFGVKLWVIMQDWGQGKAIYKDRFESFAANAGIFQAFGNVDLCTTEYLSKRLGQTIVEDRKLTETNEQQRTQGLIGEHIDRQLYPLMTGDEIARTFARNDPLKRQLVMLAGLNPMIVQRVEYYDPNSPISQWVNQRLC